MVAMTYPTIEIEEIADGEELTKARLQREQFDRNVVWLQENIAEVYSKHRGRFVCVAGQELFVADTVQEAITLAEAAHPNDDGRFTRYIPKEKIARIYAF